MDFSPAWQSKVQLIDLPKLLQKTMDILYPIHRKSSYNMILKQINGRYLIANRVDAI